MPRECPHCGATLRSNKALVPAVLMGLALTGCPTPEPDYGVPDTGPQEDSGTETAGSETGETETTSVGEPEYGVPSTT
jgi:hypothetical protein